DVISVTATASSCAQKVELYLDSALFGSDFFSPYAWTWDTRLAANGQHLLLARAYVGGGTIDSAPVTVTLSNTLPTNGARYESMLRSGLFRPSMITSIFFTLRMRPTRYGHLLERSTLRHPAPRSLRPRIRFLAVLSRRFEVVSDI